jgi:biopolymer transport protein ExbB
MKRARMWGWIGAALVMGLFAARAVFAQDATPAEGEVIEDKTMMDLIAAGGLVGYLIIILSIAGVAIAIECFVKIKRDKLCPPHIVVEIERLIEEGQYDEAVALCEGTRCYLTNVVGAAVARSVEGPDAMTAGMEEALDLENLKLMHKISYLSLLGNLGPMLGLTGTVTGMIGAFTVIERLATPSPAQLARGIYEALVTTAEGLFLAIPILTCYFILKNVVQKLSLELGGVCGELVDRLKVMAEGGAEAK